MSDTTFGPEDNLISGGTGIDFIDGGNASDTIDYSAALHGVIVDLTGGSARRVALLSTKVGELRKLGDAEVSRLVAGDEGQHLRGLPVLSRE